MAIDVVSRFFAETAVNAGIPADILRMAVCLILNFPLCAILKRLPPKYPVIKEVFILAVAYVYLNVIFGLWSGMLLLLSLSVGTYMFASLFKSYIFFPWLTFITMMTMLMRTHIVEQSTGEDYVNELGISGPQMILTLKLISFAWDMYDGSRPVDQLSTFQKQVRVVQRPSLLSFLSWCFFFPSMLTCPLCSFKEFQSWLDLSMFSTIPSPHKSKRRDSVSVAGDQQLPGIPRTSHVALLKAAEGLFWVYLYFQAGSYISSEYLWTSDYSNSTFSRKAVFLWLLAVSYQLKYFLAWTLTEAACILCGLGYNGVNEKGKLKWDRVANVKPIKILTAQNAFQYINNWNMNTGSWLRNYVYLRVTGKGKKPGAFATLCTFIVSAIWHGTKFGYYLTFALGALLQMFGKVYRKRLRPVFENSSYKYGYDFVCWVCTQLAFAFAVQPFMLLDIAPSMSVWASVYYYVPLTLAFSWLVLIGPLKPVARVILRQWRRDLRHVE